MWTADQLRSALRSYDRTPFLDVLADWIECAPSIDSITRLAESHPEKFMVAVTSLSKVAGFSERRELAVDVTHNVKRMSDSQLEDRLRVLAQRLGMSLPQLVAGISVPRGDAETIDHEPAQPAPEVAKPTPEK